jgi:hypothetical protein
MTDREWEERDASPWAAVIDRQTVRTLDQKRDKVSRTLDNGSTDASGAS